MSFLNSIKRNDWTKAALRFSPLVFAVCFGLYTLIFVQFFDVFEFDGDEGYNVVKALLLERGYSLYDQIWSDQPPLYTYLIWAVFRCFGWQIVYGRILTLLFACGLLFALYDSLRMEFGVLAGFFAAISLVFSNSFIGYSVSVMLGLPSLAMVVLALWAIVRWRHSSRWHFLFLSACFMAVSLSIKLFTLFLLPVFAIQIILCCGRMQTVRMTKVAGWLAVCVAAAVLCMLPVLFSGNARQLLGSHVTAATLPHPYGKMLFMFFKEDMVLFYLAFLGMLSLFKRRSILGVTYATWLLSAVAIYYRHYPVWHHHVTVLAIPACALTGIALDYLYGLLQRFGVKQTIAMIGCVALLSVSVFYSAYVPGEKGKRLVSPWHYSIDKEDYAALAAIERNLKEKRTMIASRPMFVFRSNTLTPPSIAVATDKRFVSGLIDVNDIVKEIDLFQPKVVVLSKKWKRNVVKKIENVLRGRYDIVYDKYLNHRRSVRVYVRKPDVVFKTPVLVR